MSLVPALDELDHKSDHGWSQANRFSNTVTVSQPGSDIEHWQHSSNRIQENYHQRQTSSLHRDFSERESSKSHWQHTENQETGEDWQEESENCHRDNEETGEHWQEESENPHRGNKETGDDWPEETAHPHTHQEDSSEDWQDEQVHRHQEWKHTDRQDNTDNWEEERGSSLGPEDWQHNFRAKNWQQEQIRHWKQDPRRNIPDNWQPDEESEESREDWQQEERAEPRGNCKQVPRRNIPDNWQPDKEFQESREDWQQGGRPEPRRNCKQVPRRNIPDTWQPDEESQESREDWHREEHSEPRGNWKQVPRRNIPSNWEQDEESQESREDWQQEQRPELRQDWKQVPRRNIPDSWQEDEESQESNEDWQQTEENKTRSWHNNNLTKSQENWQQRNIHKNWQQVNSLEPRSNWQQKGRGGGNNWQKENFSEPAVNWQLRLGRDSAEDWDEEELPEEPEDWSDRIPNKSVVWQGDGPDQRQHHWQSHHKGRDEEDYWQQDNKLPQSRPVFHPVSRREAEKNWQGKNTRRREEEEEHWQQDNKLPESRPGWHPSSRREGDKNYQRKNIRREQEGNLGPEDKSAESRPSWHSTSRREADKNWQGENTRREKDREHWQQKGELPEPRVGFHPTSKREVGKNLQGQSTRNEEEEHWQQENKLPESKPGWHPTSRREADKNLQREETPEIKDWQLQQHERLKQQQIGNWQQEDSSEEESLEDWYQEHCQEPVDNWEGEESLDSTENWDLLERQKASQNLHQEESSESDDNWSHPEKQERTKNWQDSKQLVPPKSWQPKESQQKRENWKSCEVKTTAFEKQPERPGNWKETGSTERQTHPSKPTEDWPESHPSKRIEDWPDSESDGPPEDWEGRDSSEESLPPSDLSEPDDWPDIDLPEPIQENNKQPIIQEIREEDIVSVPSNIIKSVPGTPQATLVSTPKGRSVLVHSEGDQYLVVSPSNKQSPRSTTLSQLVTFRPRHNIHNILARKDNPKNFQLRAPNQHSRFPIRGPNLRGNSPRTRIASNSTGIRLIHSEEGRLTVFPAGSPSKSASTTYYLPATARGRGRGRGSVIPPNRGGSNRSRGQNIRGRGNSPMIRPPRGALNVQYNQNIQVGRFPNQVRLVNPSPRNPQPQIFRPRGDHLPRIIRCKVARNPTIGHQSSVPIVTSVPASSSSGISVNNVTSTSEHNLPIQQQEITSLSSEKDSSVSEDSQSVGSLQSSQMIVDHEYAASEPNTKSSESAASNRQGTDHSDSDSSQSCHTNIETTYPPSDGNGQTSPESSQDSHKTSGSLPGTPVPNKKNTKPLGTGKLEINTVYLMKSPNFPERKMIWNGETFVEYNEKTYTITSEDSDGNMSGGGVGENNHGKQIRGNATGLHMTQNRSMIVRPGNPSQPTTKVLQKTTTNQMVTNDILPNGRTWKHTTNPSAILTRRPLHPDSDKKVTAIIVDTSPAGKSKRITVLNDSTLSASSSSSSQESVQTQSQDGQVQMGQTDQDKNMQQQQIVESKKRKRLQESGYEEGECVVHCKYCGYSSSNVMFCDSCHRAFPDDVKIEPLIKKGRTCVSVKENEKNVAIDKRTFYGQKLAEQSQPYQSNIVHVTSEGEIIKGKGMNTNRYRMVRISSARRKPAMPVTVTISSDEEDETSARPSSAGSSAAAEETDSLSQIIAEIPKGKPSSPKFNTSRVQKMEDEMGNPVLVRKAGRKNVHVIPVNRSVLDNPNCVKVKSIPHTPQQMSVHLKVRCIRIGSLRGVPIEPIFISADGVFLYIECEENSHRIIIEPQHVIQCLVCSRTTPVIFIRTTPEFGQDLRLSLKMENDTEGPYFDPQHSDMKHQYIMLLLQDFGNAHYSLLNILSQYSNSHKEVKKDFICDISPEEADQIFKNINFDSSVLPNIAKDNAQNNPVIENQMEVSQRSDASNVAGMSQENKAESHERSPSPKIMFSGPVKKLITFPPPPAKGGITVTNEDLFCLTEGEFLNDVIIDFYLKYLLLERLSEEDRKRTHIFSSFFFKRLTQRLANRPEDGATPAEKRHSRVKTWTKHVDLFEKDFIVVPINEHSHWFLAIICFPGLLQNETVTFIPKNRLELNMQINSEKSIPKQDSSASSNQNDTPKTESTTPEEKLRVEQCENQEQEESKEQNQPQPQEQDQKQQQQEQEQQENQQEQQQEPQQEGKKQEEGQQQQQEGQQQQQQEDEEMKDIGDKQTDESSSKETRELEPGEIPMDTSNTGVTKILPAWYFSKEPRGRLVTKEELEDPEIANMTVTGSKQPCIMVFDSLSGVSRSRIVTILKEYLQVEWAKKKQTEMNLKERLRGGSPKVPQQTNYSDCGVYVLQYVESFFEDPIQDFSSPMKSLQTWFSGERIRRKREEIKELILTISELQHKS